MLEKMGLYIYTVYIYISYMYILYIILFVYYIIIYIYTYDSPFLSGFEHHS